MKAHFVSTTGKNARAETDRVKIEIRSAWSKWRDKKAHDEKPKTVASRPREELREGHEPAAEEIGPAFARASQLLTHAWVGIMRVSHDTKEKERSSTVRDVRGRAIQQGQGDLSRVFDVVCARTVHVYYRGTGARRPPSRTTRPPS